VRKEPRRVFGLEDSALCYVHSESGWAMALVTAAEEEDEDEEEREWRFLAPTTRRGTLAHAGDTLIPGSGRRWRHLSHTTSLVEDSTAVTEAKDADSLDDELPWQVIALLDQAIVRDLLASQRYRDSKVSASMRGEDLPRLSARSAHALALEGAEKTSWLYVVVVDEVRLDDDLDRRRLAVKGDLLKVVEVAKERLILANGASCPADACRFVDAASRPRLATGVDLDDEEDLYDKPFEPRIEDDVVVCDEEEEEEDLDDDDGASVATTEIRGDAYEVAQPARQCVKAVGDACVVLDREGRPSEATVTAVDGDSVTLRDSLSLEVRLESRAAYRGTAGSAFWLGVDPEDRANFTRAGLEAAFRAAERDAAFDSRVKGITRAQALDASRRRREAFATLGTRVFPSSSSTMVLSPLEAVARGAAGARAAFAARRALRAVKLADAKRGVAALRQLVCDEAARGGAGEDLCRLRLAASLAATHGLGGDDDFDHVDAEEEQKDDSSLSFAAAPKVVAATQLLRKGRRRDEAAALLKKALDLGPSAGPDAAWASETAATKLRGISRATRLKTKADDAYRRGNLADARDVYSDAVDSLRATCPDDAWLMAALLSNRSACRRRLRELDAALADADAALRLFPRYEKPLFRRAVVLLELDRPLAAKRAFLDLLRVNRAWPKLSQWLTRCVAHLKRKHPRVSHLHDLDDLDDLDDDDDANEDSPGSFRTSQPLRENKDAEMSNPEATIDHYTVLGVDADASHGQLKRAYRIRSLKFHPDKASGSTIAFQRVAEAFEVLSDPDKRSQYDLGEDLHHKRADASDSDSDNQQRSLHEQVERKWFPERYEFYPFGDPFVEKRKLRARQARARNSSSSKTTNWWDPETATF